MVIGIFKQNEIHEKLFDYVRWTQTIINCQPNIIRHGRHKWSYVTKNGNDERDSIDRVESSREKDVPKLLRVGSQLLNNILSFYTNKTCDNESKIYSFKEKLTEL